MAWAAFGAALLPAQLVSPNATGDAIGHIHLNVKDIEAHQSFWTKVGGTPVNNEKLQMMQFPGIYIILRKQDSTGGTVGSVVNHFGLKVKNLNDWMPKWKAAGLTIEATPQPKPRITQEHVDAFARDVHYVRDVPPRVPAGVDKMQHRPLLDRKSYKEILRLRGRIRSREQRTVTTRFLDSRVDRRPSYSGFGETLLSARIGQAHDRTRDGNIRCN